MRPLTTVLFVLLIMNGFYGNCANVAGVLTGHINHKIKLFVYDGLARVEVASATTDRHGRFLLNCPDGYLGMGYLEIPDEGRLELVLNNSDIRLAGRNILESDKIRFRNSEENRLYYQFLTDHKRRDDLLLELHKQLSQSPKDESHNRNIDKSSFSDQIKKSVREELDFINGLDKETYISWYIPSIRFIHDMSVQAKYNPSFIPFFIEDFRRLDLADKRFLHSGIYCDLLEGHFVLLENMNDSKDEVYSAMCQSINYIIKSLEGKDDKLLAQIDSFLSNQLKESGFGELSKYLSLTNLAINSENAKK
jgi:hypothetical protein